MALLPAAAGATIQGGLVGRRRRLHAPRLPRRPARPLHALLLPARALALARPLVQRPLAPAYPRPLQLIGRAAAMELGVDMSDYPTYSSDHNDLVF